jgi:CPA2 family monovalent cation:H+ antiporter-2
MPELEFLRDLVLVFAVAVAVVVLLRRLRLPSISGFIVAGALVGPNALALVPDVHEVELLAEIGVVLLLFEIGLELSLERVRRMWRAVLLGGTLQVLATAGVTTLIARSLGVGMRQALALGAIVAISSTAIVLRGMAERGELETPHGRLTVGILVFQDLSVVPMMLSIPILAGTGLRFDEALLALGKSLALLVLVIGAAGLIAPRLLHLVAKTRQRDLFILAVAVVCLATAWAASSIGVSLALGAFLGGLVVSGSQYRHQALADVIPFREVLTSVFFISIGMLIDHARLVGRLDVIGAMTLAILLGKFAIVFFVGVAMRLPLRICVLAGAALAQVGEFSFVLGRAAESAGLLVDPLAADLLVAIVLTQLVTPMALVAGPHIAAGVSHARLLTRLLDVKPCEDASTEEGPLEEHVIVAGWGATGQELVSSLQSLEIPHVVVDLNPTSVRQARAAGCRAFYGDVTSAAVLEHVGADTARSAVIAINDPLAAERAVRALRSLAPRLHILVRARYLADIEDLLAAGASEVVTAELEAAVEVTGRVLARLGLEPARIAERAARMRRRT